jgi:hypothetical protein
MRTRHLASCIVSFFCLLRCGPTVQKVFGHELTGPACQPINQLCGLIAARQSGGGIKGAGNGAAHFVRGVKNGLVVFMSHVVLLYIAFFSVQLRTPLIVAARWFLAT